MSNDLVTTTDLSVAEVQAAFKRAAEERKGVQGTFLKCNKGDWVYGEANQMIPLGTKMIAFVGKMKRGWIKWGDGKPVESRINFVAGGPRMPTRKELPDMDQTLWDLGQDGKPRDPWQKTYYLPMMSESGKLYTFTTNSVGGENCLVELGDFYADHIGFAPLDLPVVKLGNGSYLHKIKTRGRVKFPTLVISHWVHKDKISGLLNEPTSGEEYESEDPGQGMDEEIPF